MPHHQHAMNQLAMVFVNLPEEGSPTIYGVPAEVLDNGTYKLLTPPNYDPEDIIMQFLPGSIVRCEKKVNRGKEILLAVEQLH